MLEPRFVMAAPPACPNAVQPAAPVDVDQRPCCDTLAITVSRSGRAETSERLPHSDAIPVRLPAAGTHDDDAATELPGTLLADVDGAPAVVVGVARVVAAVDAGDEVTGDVVDFVRSCNVL